MPFRATANLNAWVLALLEETHDEYDNIHDKMEWVLLNSTPSSIQDFAFDRLVDVSALDASVEPESTLLTAILNTIDLQCVRRTFLDWAAAAMDTENTNDATQYAAQIRALL